jgi:hypothetical protein
LSPVISYWHRLWDAPAACHGRSRPPPAGRTFDEAVAEMADALRDCAHDWHDHLLNVANDRENRGLS